MIKCDKPIIYLGFNDPRVHVRGVENVIRLQSHATTGRKYYIFRGTHPECFCWGDFIAISISMNYFTSFFLLRTLLKRIEKRHGTPIVHAHQYLLAVLVITRCMIFTVHDALGYHKKHVGSKSLWLFKIIEWIVYLKAQKIHAISHFAWNNAAGSDAFKSKVSIIYNSTWSSTDEMYDLENRFGDGPGYYLVVRSIEERANFNLIFNFAKQLQQEKNSIKIKIVGKGPKLNEYRDMAKQQDLTNIEFLGYVDDDALNVLYYNSVCVIMPALYGEGFGLPLIEAYARGIPAIGSSVCAVPEVIYAEDLLFDNDVYSLTKAVQQALKVDRNKFREYFQEKFERNKIIFLYVNLYKSLQVPRP